MNESCSQFVEKKKEGFHFVVTKLILIMKHVYPDAETAIWFLCVNVSKSGKDNL